MLILGFSAYHGDVSAVLLRDGQLVAALEEERFRRIKHCAGVPREAIARCLQIGGVRAADIDVFAVPRAPRAHLGRKILFALRHPTALRLVRAHRTSSVRLLSLPGIVGAATGLDPARVAERLYHVEHHPAHLASAFFASGVEDATVCAIDGFGDFVSTSWGAGSGRAIEVTRRTFFPHSLGLLYLGLTQYLGFPAYGDEYKVMGLAAYGKPCFADHIRRLITLHPSGEFTLSLEYFRHWTGEVTTRWEEGSPEVDRVWAPALEELLGPARQPGSPLDPRHADIAASLQAVFEEAMFHVLRAAHARHPLETLCLAGGCAMNSVANGKIRASTPFRRVYVQPAAGDSGLALGAALHAWHAAHGGHRVFVMDHASWGTSYDDETIGEVLDASAELSSSGCGRACLCTDRLLEEVAGHIAAGRVVGWFQGRMEWGPRALGHRSILADPRRGDMRAIINSKIKLREEFRPFAPSVVEECKDTYFIEPADDPFMTQVCVVRPDKRALIPAVTHVDGTARLQVVSRRTSPIYWSLLRTFGDLTGVPVLLNTSFNENEPIVEHPAQALACFLRTDMDVLAIGSHLLVKPMRAA